MARAPTHVGPRPNLGSAQQGAACCPPHRCPAPAGQRDGQGTHTRGALAQAGRRPAGSGIMSSPPLPGTSRLRLSRAAWPLAVMAAAPTHVGPRPTPGFADGEWHHALPSAAQHQPSSPMARATAPRTRGTPAQAASPGGEQHHALPSAARQRPSSVKAVAPLAHTREALAQAGLRPTGSGITPPPFRWPGGVLAVAPTHVRPPAPAQAGLRRSSPGGERHHALSSAARHQPSCASAALHLPSGVMAVAPTHVGPLAKPGFALHESHCALPSAARHQPSSAMAAAPTHVGPPRPASGWPPSRQPSPPRAPAPRRPAPARMPTRPPARRPGRPPVARAARPSSARRQSAPPAGRPPPRPPPGPGPAARALFLFFGGPRPGHPACAVARPGRQPIGAYTLGLQPCASRRAPRAACSLALRAAALHAALGASTFGPLVLRLRPLPAPPGPAPDISGLAASRYSGPRPLRPAALTRWPEHAPHPPRGGSARESPSRAHSHASVACMPLFGDEPLPTLLQSSVPAVESPNTADLPSNRQPSIPERAASGRPAFGRPAVG